MTLLQKKCSITEIVIRGICNLEALSVKRKETKSAYDVAFEYISERKFLSFELGHLPWSLAAANGSPCKTIKSKLAQMLTKDIKNDEICKQILQLW